MSLKEFLYCIGVPFGDAEGFLEGAFLVVKLDDWIETAEIFNLKILKLAGTLRLDKGLDLKYSS